MIDPSHVGDNLSSNIVEKWLVGRIQSITELELPTQQHSTLVGKIVHEVNKVSARSPDSEHVLISSNDCIKESLHPGFCDSRPERIWWSETRALGVELMAVHLEMPIRAGFDTLGQLLVGDIRRFGKMVRKPVRLVTLKRFWSTYVDHAKSEGASEWSAHEVDMSSNLASSGIGPLIS